MTCPKSEIWSVGGGTAVRCGRSYHCGYSALRLALSHLLYVALLYVHMVVISDMDGRETVLMLVSCVYTGAVRIYSYSYRRGT